MAPALIKTKVASEVAKNGVSLVSSKPRLHRFFERGQVWDKGKHTSFRYIGYFAFSYNPRE